MLGRLTVLYDADCGVCTHTARLLARVDSRHRLRLVPLQAAALPGLPPREVLMRELHAVDGLGRTFAGGAAAAEIARRVPLLWPLGVVARLPLAMPVIDALYRVVADNRQHISRLLRLDVCRVPSREV